MLKERLVQSDRYKVCSLKPAEKFNEWEQNTHENQVLNNGSRNTYKITRHPRR